MRKGLTLDLIKSNFKEFDLEKAAKLPEGSKRKFGTNWYIKQGGKWKYLPSGSHKEHAVGKHAPDSGGGKAAAGGEKSEMEERLEEVLGKIDDKEGAVYKQYEVRLNQLKEAKANTAAVKKPKSTAKPVAAKNEQTRVFKRRGYQATTHTSYTDTKVTNSVHGEDIFKMISEFQKDTNPKGHYEKSRHGVNKMQNSMMHTYGSIASSTSQAVRDKALVKFHDEVGAKLKEVGFKKKGNNYTHKHLGDIKIRKIKYGKQFTVRIDADLSKKSYIDREYHTSQYD